MDLPQDVLRAAVCGVLLVKGWPEDQAAHVLEHSFDLSNAPLEVRQAVHEVASVALTFEVHGLLKQRTQAN